MAHRAQAFLPAPDSPEGLQLAGEYAVSTAAQRQDMSDRYGYGTRASFQTMMKRTYRLGVPNHEELTKTAEVTVQVTAAPTPPEPIETVVNLTIPKLMEYTAKPHKEGQEETMILDMSDLHLGKVTPSYNPEVAKERLHNLFKAVMAIATLHRNLYPINKLVIIDTGDRGQGENPHQGSKVPEITMGARDQQKFLVLPYLTDLYCSLKQHFVTVEAHLLPGNHGHDKLNPETSSWDIVGQDLLETQMAKEPGITIHNHTDWYALFTVQGFKCFAAHLDGIPCAQGIPYFGIDRKLKAWYIEHGGFNYAFGGHFHKFTHAEVTRRFEYFMAPSFVTDDEWALKKLGVSASPGATVIGMHPVRGRTWVYNLEIDPDYRPVPVPQIETIDPAEA